LFYKYLNITPKLHKLYKSPFRDDKQPSCSFYVNKKQDLVLKDFGTGSSYTWINAVMERYNCTYHKALEKVATDIGLIVSNGNFNIKEIPIIPKV